MAHGRAHQRLGLEPLRPQRRAHVRPPPRQQQGARGVLAKMGGEQRRSRQLGQQQVVQLLGGEDEIRRRRRLVGGGEAQRDAVVAPQRLHLEPGAGAQARLQRQRPRRVHARPERRQQTHAPVAQLVAKPFQRDLPIGRQRAGRLLLRLHVPPQVDRRPRLQRMLRGQHRRRRRLVHGPQRPRHLAQRPPHLQRPARPLAAPERHLARLARGRLHDDPVARDLLDAPAAGAQQERLADTRFVHHLLVQLADARAALAQVHAVKPAVGDGAAVDQGDDLGVAPRGQDVGRAVPDDARP